MNPRYFHLFTGWTMVTHLTIELSQGNDVRKVLNIFKLMCSSRCLVGPFTRQLPERILEKFSCLQELCIKKPTEIY